MADLVVTYSGALPSEVGGLDVGLRVGRGARTESVTIGGTSAASTNAAQGGEICVSLHAGAACWVTVGAAPTAVVGSGWYIPADGRDQLGVLAGDKVAVIAAA